MKGMARCWLLMLLYAADVRKGLGLPKQTMRHDLLPKISVVFHAFSVCYSVEVSFLQPWIQAMFEALALHLRAFASDPPACRLVIARIRLKLADYLDTVHDRECRQNVPIPRSTLRICV